MNNEIEFSEKFMVKYIKSIFNLRPVTPIRSYIAWVIDSEYRTTERLDLFLKQQLINPAEELNQLADEFSKIKDYDKRIISILEFVVYNFNYETDINNHNKVEFWEVAKTVLDMKSADCEGLNGLIFIIARLSGIPSWLIWSCIGSVNVNQGHYWLLYYSTTQNKLVSIDATYYPDLKIMKKRKEFQTDLNYTTIWYMFNDTTIFKYS